MAINWRTYDYDAGHVKNLLDVLISLPAFTLLLLIQLLILVCGHI